MVLKKNHAPTVSLHKRTLQIELYNDAYFPSHSRHICKTSVNTLSCEIDTVAFQEYACESTIPSATLFEAIKTASPLKESQHDATYIIPFPPSMDFSDKLLFFQYTPKNIMRQ